MDDGIVVVPKEMGRMKESLADLGRKVDDLGRGLRAEIRALKEETGAQDEATRESIDRRLTPLEAAERARRKRYFFFGR